MEKVLFISERDISCPSYLCGTNEEGGLNTLKTMFAGFFFFFLPQKSLLQLAGGKSGDITDGDDGLMKRNDRFKNIV